MIRNYIKIALRNLIRHRSFTLLNVFGLAIGMASMILILLWVRNELSYDRSFDKSQYIYRLTSNVGPFKAAVTPAGMGPGLQQVIPQIRSCVRVSRPTTSLFEAAGHKFSENRVFYADSDFFKLFSFPLDGDPVSALSRPNNIVISKDIATKYFGSASALGKTIVMDNREIFVVTGVADDILSSSLQFDCILPLSSVMGIDNDLKTSSWKNFNFYTYFELDHTINPSRVASLIPTIKDIYNQHNQLTKADFTLQPLTEIHLHSDLQIDLPGQGNILYVRSFLIVAFFILAVACINFMNLATAKSSRRAKEIGLRKVMGSRRSHLIIQFFGESMIISIISLVIAIALVFISLPAFNNLTGKVLSIRVGDGYLWSGMLGIAILTGFLAGSYPAIFLSGFNPVSVLKGKLNMGGGSLLLRNSLVILQFCTAIILLTGTVVVYMQLNFIKNKNLGFEKSNLIYMRMTGDIWNKIGALRSVLAENSQTSNFTIISNLPVSLTTGQANVQWEGKDPNLKIVIPNLDIDENFLSLFKIDLLQGRGFSREFNGDSTNYLINEKAMKVMEMKPRDVLGQKLSFNGVDGSIIGVIKDFNFKPLQYPIEPLVLRLSKNGGVVVVKAGPGEVEGTLKQLEKVNAQLNPTYPFSFNFVDNDLDNLYRGERQMGHVFQLFALLSILISCMGLYGLSAFIAEQRKREIAVRKVLGASSGGIVYLLSGKFTQLILLALVIAMPISWILINNWLKGFEYRIAIPWTAFLYVPLLTLVIAWLTVGTESIKAASSNPIKSLRNE